MSVSNNVIIVGIVLGVLCGGLIILWRRRYRDLFAGFLVVGILALAVVVTVYQINQYRQQRAVATPIAQAEPMARSGSSSPPPAPVIVSPPIGMRGPTGAAAPSVVPNPYAGGAR